uniref:Uncharacterized protein n=1 Tax=Anguilla anguilla TaxID=7936 RepID=A0A0E9W777_ANGAN
MAALGGHFLCVAHNRCEFVPDVRFCVACEAPSVCERVNKEDRASMGLCQSSSFLFLAQSDF